MNKALRDTNEQVKRNRDRFPEDFMFQFTAEEVERSRSQIATLNSGRGQDIKYRPYAFTEHGAIQVDSRRDAAATSVSLDRPPSFRHRFPSVST